MTYFLDTDTLNHFHAGQPQVVRRVAAVNPSDLAITVLTRVEILRGRFEFLHKASSREQLLRAQQRLDESEQALAEWNVVKIDAGAALQFERLRGQKGIRKIGRGDLLIACITLANRATLVTRNTRDFAAIPELQIENWVD